MLWARMVAYVTGMVNQELPLRNEYLRAENRILRGQISQMVHLGGYFICRYCRLKVPQSAESIELLSCSLCSERGYTLDYE